MADAPTQPLHVPLSWRWTAAFGRAGTLRLLATAAGVAVLFGIAVAWFAGAVVSPLVETILSRLPADSEIRSQRLHWTGAPEAQLLDSRLLTVEVVPAGRAIEGRLADVHVQLRERGVLFQSLFGHLQLPYPGGWVISLNSSEAVPIWQAWKPFLVLAAGAGAAVGALVLCLIVATALLVPLRLALHFLDRDVTLPGCWRVIVAALFPGTLLLTAAVVGYGVGAFSLLVLLALYPAHLLLDAVWLAGACWRLPTTERRLAAKKKNPFKDDGGDSGGASDADDGNMFRGRGGAGGGT